LSNTIKTSHFFISFKPGNPLVDSVAEHQAASAQAYFQYLNLICYLAPLGFAIVALIGCSPGSSFLIVYGISAYFFSLKMVRLILLAAPIASISGGIFLGYFWAWSIGSIFGNARPTLGALLEEKGLSEKGDVATAGDNKKTIKKKNSNTKKDQVKETPKSGDPLWVRAIRFAVGVYAITQAKPFAEQFKEMCHQVAKQISHPTIITKGTNRQTGETVIVDDYREAYFWLRDKTPEDARIMAWWDYGYQITGIGNRTTIADGNTWNHEHIALLGRILTGPEKDAHRIARHLADYVLIWAGGGGGT
jgi:dolichyl-diphosphooligosaccharide--protein glycosyltransferase